MIRKHMNKYIISFCMSLFFVIFLWVVFSSMLLFNDSRIFKTFEHTDYYVNVAEEINSNLQFTAGAAGMDPELFEAFVDQRDVEKDIKSYMKDSNKNETYIEKYTNSLQSFLLSKGYNEVDVQSEAMQKYIAIQAQDYVKHIKFPFMKYYNMVNETLRGTFPYLIGISGCIILVSIFLLRKGTSKSDFYQWLGYALCGSGLMQGIVPALILGYNLIEKINLTPYYYYEFFVRYVNDVLWIALLIAILFVVWGTLSYVIAIKKKVEHKTYKVK